MMKAVFIVYNQAYNMEIPDALSELGQRGSTMWKDIEGCGGTDGEPHLGNHAWPTMNNAVLTIVSDEKIAGILDFVKRMDEETPALGLRAFVWNIEQAY